MTLQELQQKLNALEVQEKGLRAALVVQLDSLSERAAYISRKIETRAYADGVCAFDDYWDRVRECEEQLIDVLGEIRDVQWQLGEDE